MKAIDIFEVQFLDFIQTEMAQDLAHDINHVMRVVNTAKQLCEEEHARKEVVIPAAYLHDCFSFEKNHPNRTQSSKVAADKAISFLMSIDYPSESLQDIHHAIIAHSFSANVDPITLEAKIVQDADRLDALGAIGITRCIQVSSTLGRSLYSSEDPFCYERVPDDSSYTLDHFYTKLLHLSSTMKTKSAVKEADKRTLVMRAFLMQLESEL